MTKEEKFYKALQDVFIGAKIEGTGGFVNLMRIKSNYYRKIEDILKKDIEEALKSYPKFRNELFDKLYSFFSRYFSESGSIYFNSTPFHNNIYEKVYTDEKDVILFWKTQMLYYIKTDRIFRSLEIESDGFKFFFDVSKLEHKKANERRSLVFKLNKVRDDGTIVFGVQYSEKGTKTKQDKILKALKKKGIAITEEQLERAFRVFEKQSEVDFFINKNAKAFLQEQFKLWSYQYFWEGAKEWSAVRVNELQILKDIAFKIIDFVSQFEDELVKIWNKPKFVKNSNYVITLDRIWNNSRSENVYHRFPSERGVDAESGRGVSNNVINWNELPFNPELKARAKELRKARNLAEVLFWNQVKNKQFLGLEFDRQKIIGNYIVDFYCKNLGVVIEIDGESHNYKGEYDKARDEYLKGLGLKVIHILDVDIKKNLNGVMEFLKNELNTPSLRDTALQEGNGTPRLTSSDTPLKEGNLVERILNHSGIHNQIKEWQELGIVDENFKISNVIEIDLTGKHLSEKYKHLPIDTKYFKDLELEILSLFDDLDQSLDGWLIKSENYQALNTLLPKFREKVQTIYIDPPFNLDSSDQFLYRTNYKDANWATLLENRIRIAREWLNEKGSIFVRCDYNGNWIVRCLMDEVFGKENFRNEMILKRTAGLPKRELLNMEVETEYLLYYAKDAEKLFFNQLWEERQPQWMPVMVKYNRGGPTGKPILIEEKTYNPPEGYSWAIGNEIAQRIHKEGRLKIENGKPYVLIDKKTVGSNWTDIPGYVSPPKWGFSTENHEKLLKRSIETSSNEGDLVMDFFLGSGTTTAVAHKLKRKWIGVEMGEHFYSVVLPRMKKVLAYDKSGISKENYVKEKYNEKNAGGFFKYYELEQYEEALNNCVYEDSDLFTSSDKSPYEQYVFLKDEKMLKAIEIDYKNKKVKVDLDILYSNIDMPETLSNLTGKWIKRITPRLTSSATPLKEGNYEVEFEDGTKINTKDLDYKLIKPLIWWE